MKFVTPAVLALPIFLATSCGADVADPAAHLDVLSSAQLDSGTKSYVVTQWTRTVLASWAGTISTGSTVEYWATMPAYNGSAPRTFAGASQTCTDFHDMVCGTGWTGATYYQGIYSQKTLNCDFPPGPCRAPSDAVSLLAAGSHRTRGANDMPFAWTYVAGQCEYWAMQHTISDGSSIQSPQSPGYSSLRDFESQVCAMNPVPTTWYTAYYIPLTAFCSSIVC